MRTVSIALASTVLMACVRTTLETSDPRANPEAYSARTEQPAAALKPGFDPFHAYPDDAAGEPEQGGDAGHHHHHHHGHGSHEMAPADAGNQPGSMDHSTHGSGEKKQPAAQVPPNAAASFTCPMHPEIVRDSPGRCPTCGMDLVPKKPQSTHPPD